MRALTHEGERKLVPWREYRVSANVTVGRQRADTRGAGTIDRRKIIIEINK